MAYFGAMIAALGGHMRAKIRFALIAAPLLLGMGMGTALCDGVSVKIINNGTQDVVVTVYDTSTRPYKEVLTGARINGFTSIPVSMMTDATGRANLAWTATSVDPNDRKCGHASSAGLKDADTVSVYADSECSA
jgi:hypothetical protein